MIPNFVLSPLNMFLDFKIKIMAERLTAIICATDRKSAESPNPDFIKIPTPPAERPTPPTENQGPAPASAKTAETALAAEEAA